MIPFLRFRGFSILDWTLGLGALLATAAVSSAVAAPAALSSEGSGRATAYSEQNKIITSGDRTHVVWLDAVEAGFRVRGRTLNRTTGEWGAVVTLGEAQDNHGGPALTIDREGYLHVVFYPHHQPIRYRRSVRPNDLSEWTPEIQFGEGLSYPVLLCAPDNTLVLTARRGFFDEQGKYQDEHYLEQELWVKPSGGHWGRKATLFRGRFPRYAQFAPALVWGPDGKTLHLSCRIYESNPDSNGKPAYTIGYMRSPDRGQTWTTAAGRAIALPASAETLDVLVRDNPESGLQLSAGPLGVSAAGIPYVLYSAETNGDARLYLATTAANNGWTHRDLTEALPAEVRGWKVNLGMGGGMTFSASGRATIVAVVLNPPPADRGTLKEWGHATAEVVRLWSDDGGKTFSSEMLRPVDPQEPHWLVNVERPTGFNVVPASPGIIYTAGSAGGGLKDLMLGNRVIWHSGNEP